MKKLYEDIRFLMENKENMVTLSVPLFIRCLEWAKETAKGDLDLHKLTDNIIGKGKPLFSSDYENLFDGIEGSKE